MHKGAQREENVQEKYSTYHTIDKIIPDHDEFANGEYLRIGDLSREFGVSLRTLRFYEDRNLLFPKRRGATRLYSGEQRARLKLILMAKRVGMSILEIQDLLKLYDSDSGLDAIHQQLLKKFEGQRDVLKVQLNEITQSQHELEAVIHRINKLIDESE